MEKDITAEIKELTSQSIRPLMVIKLVDLTREQLWKPQFVLEQLRHQHATLEDEIKNKSQVPEDQQPTTISIDIEALKKKAADVWARSLTVFQTIETNKQALEEAYQALTDEELKEVEDLHRDYLKQLQTFNPKELSFQTETMNNQGNSSMTNSTQASTMKNKSSQAIEEDSDSDFDLMINRLDHSQWLELFQFGEQIIVKELGVYLPSKWYAHAGVASEVLDLCFEYIACREMNRPLTTWFTHLENLARHSMAPYLDTTPGSYVLDEHELASLSRHLFGASLSGYKPEPRTSYEDFNAYLHKRQGKWSSWRRVSHCPLHLGGLVKLVESTKKK
jgi:uncharacterized protein YnzC (UPF0291/DUF896 family)